MVKKGRRDIHGILLINKPEGLTSAAVVARIKRKFKLYKVGHAGTLDPIATGVLPICINEGTKLAGYLSNKGKSYRTLMRLGAETDTQDRTGEIIAENPVDCTESDVLAALESFKGKFEQLPPMFSAKKKDGQPLYKMARLGEEVVRKAVPVEVTKQVVHNVNLPLVDLSVTVSKGFYIRTLCHDTGQKLGCGAYMETLQRTRHGSFKLEDCVELEQAEEMDFEQLKEKIIPLGSDLIDIPVLIADQTAEKDLSYGKPLSKLTAENHCIFDHEIKSGLFRAIAEDGEILALLKTEQDLSYLGNLKDNQTIFTVERGFSVKMI